MLAVLAASQEKGKGTLAAALLAVSAAMEVAKDQAKADTMVGAGEVDKGAAWAATRAKV